MKVEAWVVLKATRNSWSKYPTSSPYAGQEKVDKVRVVKVAQNKPSLQDDEITMKLEMDVDESWFLDGTATIKAVVPAQPAAAAQVQAQVDMPIRGRGKSAAAGVIHP